MTLNKKAQIWYYDFISGFMIFSIVLAIFFVNFKTSDDSLLLNEASKISRHLMKTGIPENWNIDNVNQIGIYDKEFNITKINYLKTIQYNNLKSKLNIKSDFIILYEDEIINGKNYSKAKNIAKIERIGIEDNRIKKLQVITWE